MAFESLSERLQNAIKMFRGTKEITEEDLKAPLREVRMALLEADVNFKVVKNFVAKIKERALGAEIQQNLSPSQQIIKIVDEELTELLGGTQAKLTVAEHKEKMDDLMNKVAGRTDMSGFENMMEAVQKRIDSVDAKVALNEELADKMDIKKLEEKYSAKAAEVSASVEADLAALKARLGK